MYVCMLETIYKPVYMLFNMCSVLLKSMQEAARARQK